MLTTLPRNHTANILENHCRGFYLARRKECSTVKQQRNARLFVFVSNRMYYTGGKVKLHIFEPR